jgi:Leu/Phe-tRNA-protein transferase
MIFRDGFACRCFDITAEGPGGAVEMAGGVIIGLPQGQFPEFEREHTVQDWQRILRQILTPNDLWELNQQLGRTMRARTYFILRTTLDYKTTVETQPPYKTKSGKRFWVKGQDG